MAAAVPAVEVADDAHGARVGRPHRERDAVDAVVVVQARAEHVPQPLVPALADQVQVELAHGRQVPVRVVGDEVGTVVVGGDELVRGRLLGERALPYAGAQVVELDARAVGQDGRDGLGERAAGPDEPAVSVLVGAEDGVGCVVEAVGDRVDHGIGGAVHRVPLTCRMWTGSVKESRRTKLLVDQVHVAPVMRSSTSKLSPGSMPKARGSRWTIV